MVFLTDEILDRYKEWFVTFSNDKLVRSIDVMKALIYDDVFAESLFLDEALELLDLLREECIRRVRLFASLDGAGAE